MTKKPKAEIEQRILELVKAENPESVEQLAKLAKERLSLKTEEALNRITSLISDGKINLKAPSEPPARTVVDYLRTSEAYWFWATVFLALGTVVAVIAIPEEAYPFVFIRYVLGSIFVLWLPGYTFVKALFTSKKELDTVERIALSVGLSLALVPMVGLVLNYTPWGIRVAPITLSLLALTLAFATAAVFREHQAMAKTASLR